mgnify:CR=1 FL=1
MSIKIKLLLSALIGMLAGIAVWPLIEILLHKQNSMPSIIAANSIFGAIIGLVFGVFIGSTDGIITKSPGKIKSGVLSGLIFGLVGGVTGAVLGWILILAGGNAFFANGNNSNIMLILVKAFGWGILGVFIGLAGGFSLRSKGKAIQGVIGGFLGGFFGGIAFELIKQNDLSRNLARLAGLAVLGLFLGLFLTLTEKVFSKGILRQLNGKLKGKEFTLSYDRIKIGRSEKSDVGLFGFKMVANRHAEIKKNENSFIIEDAEAPSGLIINGKKVKKHNLHSGDIITLGDARMVFLAK